MRRARERREFDGCWLGIVTVKKGSVVCEIKERKKRLRGYIAMLSVDPAHRRKGIAKDLVLQVSIRAFFFVLVSHCSSKSVCG